MLRILAVLCCGLLLPLSGWNQDTMFVQSETLTISDSQFISEQLFNNPIAITEAPSDNIANAISRYAGVINNNGGPAMLATALSRGFGARHMAILWNGENIQSPVNGTYDLSLIPVTVFNNSSITASPLSASYGTSSMAGGVMLDQSNLKKIEIGSRISSDQNKDYFVNTRMVRGKINTNLSVHFSDHENRYSYKYGKRELEMQSAQFSNFNLQYKSTITLKNAVVSASYWGQSARRNLPVSKTSAQININQSDLNHRLSFSYDQQSESWHWKMRYSNFDERIIYKDPSVFSQADGNSSLLTASLRNSKSNSLMMITYRKDDITATFFNEEVSDQRWGMNASQSVDINPNWRASIQANYNWMSTNVSPFAVQVNTKYHFKKYWEVRLATGRHFNLPNYNDRFWPGSGNADLLPEVGYLTELSMGFMNSQSAIQATGFYNIVDNWILWAPESSDIWRPSNLRKVRSLGVSIRASHNLSMGRWKFSNYLNYDWTHTQIMEDLGFDFLKGNRLLYIPDHKTSLITQVIFKKWTLNVDGQYLSSRFTSSDNSTEVDGYFLINGEVSRNFDLEKIQMKFSLSSTNITNTDYEVVRFFPRPLRLYQLGITLNFK